MNAKTNLYKFIEEFRKTYNIHGYPVDMVNLCSTDSTTNIIYKSFNTPGLCGVAFPGDKIDTIILNSCRNTKERNFDCAHEAIHLTKHRDKCFEMFTCLNNKQDSFIEWEANEGAAELLVPYRSLLAIIYNNYSNLNSWRNIRKFKKELSEKFIAPINVIENRLENLKYEIHQYLNGTSIDNIELLSRRELNSRNLKIVSINDIENNDYSNEMNLYWNQV